MLAAEIRTEMAYQELSNHEKQIENAQQAEAFLRNKFTKEELYGWMQGEIAPVYFQCYQMAFDLAKKAERAYRFELGLSDSHFIQFGYWDSFRKGLLSGEKLYLALKQMEKSYLELNRREYELTKHISLQQFNPVAFLALKETGKCTIELPESLFNLDYHGHYMRRIKSMSLSIPCVVGPYTSINCTLTLLTSKIRIKNTLKNAEYAEQKEDDRFLSNYGSVQSITTSHAQNDSGMFELNFRDEQYLPFEGAGVISLWEIRLPKATNHSDFDSLTDVILHLKYTSREGGKQLADEALKALPKNTWHLLDVKHDFPNEWNLYYARNKEKPASQLEDLKLTLKDHHLPFRFRTANVQPEAQAFLLRDNSVDLKHLPPTVAVTVNDRTLSFKPIAHPFIPLKEVNNVFVMVELVIE